MNYLEAGDGHPVFLLHAFPLDHRMWDSQVRLLGRSHRVIAPDLPGFGASPTVPGWTLIDVAAGIFEIADGLGFGRFSTVGLSMGTYASLEIYRHGPERVDRMVLANGRARGDTPEEKDARRALAARVSGEGVRVLEETVLGRLLGPNAPEDVAASVRAAIRRARPEAVTEALAALAGRRDSTDLLGSIRCRVLVIGGSDDALTRPAECKSMADAIAGAAYAEIQGAGHLSNLENPEGFNRELAQFLG